MTAPAGFEDRPPHRGTISSVVHEPNCSRRAAQDVLVADAASVADAVEEFEDVDGDLAAAADFVAQRRRRARSRRAAFSAATLAARSATASRREIVVVRHRLELAGAGDALEQGAHGVLGDAGRLGDVAHARRVVGLGVEQRLQRQPTGRGRRRRVARGVRADAARRWSGRCARRPAARRAARRRPGGRASAASGGAGGRARRRSCRGRARVRRRARRAGVLRSACQRAGAKAVSPTTFRLRRRAEVAPAPRLSRLRLSAQGRRGRRRPRCCSAASCSAGCRIGVGQRGEHGQAFRAALLAAGRKDVEHAAAADGVAGRGIAQDEAVAGQRADVAVDADLRPVFAARRNFVGAEQRDAAGTSSAPRCRCTCVQCLSARLAGEDADRRIEAPHRGMQCRRDDPHAALDLGSFRIAAQGERNALRRRGRDSAGASCTRRLRTRTALSGRREQQLVASLDAAGKRRCR